MEDSPSKGFSIEVTGSSSTKLKQAQGHFQHPNRSQCWGLLFFFFLLTLESANCKGEWLKVSTCDHLTILEGNPEH